MHLFRKLCSKPPGDFWRIKGFDWSLISGESVAWLDYQKGKYIFPFFSWITKKPSGWMVSPLQCVRSVGMWSMRKYKVWSFQKNDSTYIRPQSLSCLEKWELKSPHSLTCPHVYATQLSLFEAINLGRLLPRVNRRTKYLFKILSFSHS